MKTAILLFALLLLFFSCKGQRSTTDYVKKLESGYKGPVQKVTTYICEVKFDAIPTDTTNYSLRIIATYDSLGNALVTTTLSRFQDSQSELTLTFSGKGKDLSCKTNYRFTDGDVTESDFRYVWLDDYQYKLDAPPEDTNSSVITLDKDFRTIKTVFKKGDTIWMSQEYNYHYQNNKLYEKITRMTENRNNGEKKLTYQVQVAQEYDQHGNPTLIYEYIDLEKKNLRKIHFIEYKYYGQ